MKKDCYWLDSRNCQTCNVWRKLNTNQWRIQRNGPGAPPPPLFLDQTEARRAKNTSFGDRRPTFSLPPTPPHLKVWIRHCEQAPTRGQFVRKSRVSAKLDGELEAKFLSMPPIRDGLAPSCLASLFTNAVSLSTSYAWNNILLYNRVIWLCKQKEPV